jgi:hypothetical protein
VGYGPANVALEFQQQYGRDAYSGPDDQFDLPREIRPEEQRIQEDRGFARAAIISGTGHARAT